MKTALANIAKDAKKTLSFDTTDIEIRKFVEELKKRKKIKRIATIVSMIALSLVAFIVLLVLLLK